MNNEIKIQGLNFNLGNAVMHISIAENGDKLKHLEEALNYIECEIESEVFIVANTPIKDELEELGKECDELIQDFFKGLNSPPINLVNEWINKQTEPKKSNEGKRKDHCDSCGHDTPSFKVSHDVKCERCCDVKFSLRPKTSSSLESMKEDRKNEEQCELDSCQYCKRPN